MAFGVRDLAQVAITATDQTSPAFDSLKRNIADLRGGIGSLQGALAGLGVGVSAGAFAALIKNAVDATAALEDMSDQTSLSVRTLSGLQQTARVFGHDMTGVTSVAQRFARSVAEAAGGNVELVRSFNALGISQERLRTARFDDIFVEFAGKVANAENRTYAVSYAMELAGRSAANSMPFFKDLSEAGLAQATVSADQAAAAGRLGDEIGKLKNEFSLLTESIGIGVVPVMLKYIEDAKAAYQETNNLMAALIGVQSVRMTFGDTAAEQIRKIDAELAALKSKQGWFDGWLANPLLGIRESGLLQARGIARSQQRLEALRHAEAVGTDDVWSRRAASAARIVLPPPPSTSTTKTDTAGPQLIAQLTNQLAELDGQSSVFEQTMRKLTDGTKKYTAEVQASALALAGEIDERKRAQAAFEEYAKVIERADAAQAAADKVLADFNRTQTDNLKNLEFETSLIGANDVQREQAIALRKLEQDYLRASIRLVGEETDAYQRRMEVTRGIYEAQRSAIPAAVMDNVSRRKAVEEHQKLIEDIKRQNEQITNSLTDALLRGFENGRGFAENFRESLKAMFSTLVLRPIIQPIAQGAAGAVTGLLGMGGSPHIMGGGIGGSIGQSLFGNGVQNLLGGIGGSIFGTSTAYASALGLSSAAAGSQAALLASQTGVFGASGLASTAAAGGAAGAAGLVSALPYVGLALGAAALLGGGNKGGPAHFTGMDAEGLITRQGLVGGAFYGNSQNSKQGFRWQTTDHWATDPFNAHVRKMFDDMEGIGRTLGLDTNRLSGFSASFSARGLSNTNSQQIADEMAAQLGGVADQIAYTLMPNLRDFAQANETATQTLMRLVQVQEQLRQQEEQARNQLAGAVRGLPGQLGITSLEGTRDALAMSEYQSPLDRLNAARSLLDQTYQRGMGGDLTAVNSFGSLLQQALGVGREVGASGPAFQSLFMDGNRQLNELLAKQQSIQQEILQSIDVTIIQTSQDQVGELRKGFTAMVDQLKSVEAELRRIREAA